MISKVFNWLFGGGADTVITKKEEVNVSDLDKAVLENTPTWPFPASVGSVPLEGAGEVEVAKPKPAAMSAKPKAAAKPKAVKAPAKPKAPAKTKPVAKPKAPAKPKAVKAASKKA